MYQTFSQPKVIKQTANQATAFNFHLAEAEDIALCAQFQSSYQTNYVWQMHLREGDRVIQSIFDQIRLPRTMTVTYPYTPHEIERILHRSDFVYLATFQNQPAACLGLVNSLDGQTLHISHLMVQPAYRRKGIGQTLLRLAKQSAQHCHCNTLSLKTQTKNFPTIQLAQKLGFAYCGYNDRYYNNGDIALSFSLTLS